MCTKICYLLIINKNVVSINIVYPRTKLKDERMGVLVDGAVQPTVEDAPGEDVVLLLNGNPAGQAV